MDNTGLADSYHELWLENGIIYQKYNSTITVETAKKATDIRLKLSNGIKIPVLNDIREIAYMTKDVRDYWSKGDGTLNISATAFLIKNNMQHLLINAFLMINRPAFPTKVFLKQEDAIRWLNYFRYLN